MVIFLGIGKLRHRITLQKYVSSKDSYGAENKVWSDLANVWASIEPISGKEYFAAQQVNAEVSTKIIIRYRKDVEPKMKIKYMGRYFEILSVIHTKEQKKELQLMCKELI
jgi:SPP1 family predicted phage head-tail adaptor